MNYDELTDKEINKLVAKALGFPVQGTGWITGADGIYDYIAESDDPDAYRRSLPDYCNSWTEAGPIIENNMICLAFDVFAEPRDGGKWVSQPAYGWEYERVRHDNPLRVAMLVFLKMKEE